MQRLLKKAATVVLVGVLDLAMQIGAVLWVFVAVPWLYTHYVPWDNWWWVFFLAMLPFTILLLWVLWFAIRRLRAMSKRWRES